jgi:predicted nucleic acid-binding protein
MILVDSSVLIDVIERQPDWVEWSVERLNDCAKADTLAINIIIYSEVSRSFRNAEALDTFLRQTKIKLKAISTKAAFASSRAHLAYRAAGGKRLATLPDFFIGAHAQDEGCILLTRDPVRIQAYFPNVQLICPPR